MNLRAVIFDYGEVLSGPPNAQRHRNLLSAAGLPEEIFERYYWKYRLDYDADILNGRTYWEKIARESGIHFTAEQIGRLNLEDAAMWMDLNPSMLAWTSELKDAGLRLGILSNMGDAVLHYVQEKFSWLNRFDHRTWSCELGIVKPDPAIYAFTIEKLGVRPAEALFIDNLEKNVAAAEAAGLHAILFENATQLGLEIRRRKLDLSIQSLQQTSEVAAG